MYDDMLSHLQEVYEAQPKPLTEAEKEAQKFVQLAKASSLFLCSRLTEVESEIRTSNKKIPIGVLKIDKITGGLAEGVNILAGFRKSAKTTFSLNVIYRSLNEGRNVCLVSLEMSKLEVLNILLAVHLYNLDPKTAKTRDQIIELSKSDISTYEEYCHSLFSLKGQLVILTEEDLKKFAPYKKSKKSRSKNAQDVEVESKTSTERLPWTCEKTFIQAFEEVDSNFFNFNGRTTELLVVDNINCIRTWERKSLGETTYALVSDFFRRVAQDFLLSNSHKVCCLLLAQINRTGGLEAMSKGYYPASCVAETVSLERDCVSLITIFVQHYSGEKPQVLMKLETSRYCEPMDEPVEVTSDLKYGVVGDPINQVKVNQLVKKFMSSDFDEHKINVIYLDYDAYED